MRDLVATGRLVAQGHSGTVGAQQHQHDPGDLQPRTTGNAGTGDRQTGRGAEIVAGPAPR